MKAMGIEVKTPIRGGCATTSGTVLDAQIQAFCESHNLEMPEKEVRFHPVREWRFDYAWRADRIAVEVEGITGGAGGRHQRRAGYADDCEKYTAASLAGWVVIRITYDQISQGKLWEYIETAFETEGTESGDGSVSW